MLGKTEQVPALELLPMKQTTNFTVYLSTVPPPPPPPQYIVYTNDRYMYKRRLQTSESSSDIRIGGKGGIKGREQHLGV